MSMGTIESCHQFVEERTVKKVVGKKLYENFMKKHKAVNEGDFRDVDEEDEALKELDKAHEALREAFKEKTGMAISYVELYGDINCYEDVASDKVYWELDGDDVWLSGKMTDNAKAFQEKYGNIDPDPRHSMFD